MTQETEYERSETSHMAGTGAGRAGWGVDGVLAGGERERGRETEKRWRRG